jgi:hypothetical protein
MSNEELLNAAANIESNSESIPLLIKVLSISQDDLACVDVSEMETEPDYALEHSLEIALDLLQADELVGDDLEIVAKLAAKNFLTLEEISGGTPREINVRAAELLTASAAKTGTIHYPEDQPFSLDTVRNLTQSQDWKARYLGALIAREHFAEDSAEIVKQLSDDPFEDEDGIYLVREAAGFSEN